MNYISLFQDGSGFHCFMILGHFWSFLITCEIQRSEHYEKIKYNHAEHRNFYFFLQSKPNTPSNPKTILPDPMERADGPKGPGVCFCDFQDFGQNSRISLPFRTSAWFWSAAGMLTAGFLKSESHIIVLFTVWVAK